MSCPSPKRHLLRRRCVFSMRTLGTRHRNPTIVLKTSAPTAFSESIHKGREFRRGSKPASSAFWAIAEMVLFLGIAAIVLAASGDWHLRRRHVARRSQNVSGGVRLGHFGGPFCDCSPTWFCRPVH